MRPPTDHPVRRRKHPEWSGAGAQPTGAGARLNWQARTCRLALGAAKSGSLGMGTAYMQPLVEVTAFSGSHTDSRRSSPVAASTASA